MHFSPQSSDQHLPDRTLRSTIETFPSSTSIQELTLNNATIPWSIFSGLLSLSSINLENVKIGDRPGEGIRFIPTPNQRAEIKHFRFRNCTDIVRKFVLVRPSHALSFDNLVSLECDMGSLESTNYGALLIDNCHQSLEALTLDYRANEDQAAKDLRVVDINLGEIEFPSLRSLEISEVYDITEFIPCAALIEHIRTIALTSPKLTDLRFIIHGFPAVAPSVFFSSPTGYYSFVQYGINKTLAQLDHYLESFCDQEKGDVMNLSMRLSFVRLELDDIERARGAIEVRLQMSLNDIDHQFTVTAPTQNQFEELTRSIMHSCGDLRRVLSEDFLSARFPKVYAHGGSPTINIELECTT